MRDGDYLPSNIVVQSVDRVGVDEAVSHPDTSSDHLTELADNLAGKRHAMLRVSWVPILFNAHLKRSLNPVLVNSLVSLVSLLHSLSIVGQNVVCVFSRQAYQLTTVRPVHLNCT